MGKRDDLIALYARELRDRCGMEPDPDLLTAVTLGCGPLIYHADTAVVSPEDAEDLARVRENFLVRKLDLMDGPELSDAIAAVLAAYGSSGARMHRAVVYYMLVKLFRKEGQFI